MVVSENWNDEFNSLSRRALSIVEIMFYTELPFYEPQ